MNAQNCKARPFHPTPSGIRVQDVHSSRHDLLVQLQELLSWKWMIKHAGAYGYQNDQSFWHIYLLMNSEQVEKIAVTILQTDDDYNNDDIVGWEKILGTFQAQNISKSKLQGWPDFNSSVLFHF